MSKLSFEQWIRKEGINPSFADEARKDYQVYLSGKELWFNKRISDSEYQHRMSLIAEEQYKASVAKMNEKQVTSKLPEGREWGTPINEGLAKGTTKEDAAKALKKYEQNVEENTSDFDWAVVGFQEGLHEIKDKVKENLNADDWLWKLEVAFFAILGVAALGSIAAIAIEVEK
jgi:hypothetical protein